MGRGTPEDVQSTEADGEIMAALDDSTGVTKLVVADITTDDAWLTILASEAPVLEYWR